jgi:hypothetical protein
LDERGLNQSVRFYDRHLTGHHKGVFYQYRNSKCPDNGREVVSQEFSDTAPTTEVETIYI